MAKTLQFRRGTTSELSTQTGAVGELFVDTTKDTVVVMDGSTAGGFPLQVELLSGTNIKTINGQSVLGSGDITISGGSGSSFDQELNTTDDVVFNSALVGNVTIVDNAISATDSYGNADTLIVDGDLDVIGQFTVNGQPVGGSSFSGSYNDLTDKPFIPNLTSQLMNDAGFITNSSLSSKQDVLYSGMNIRTINGQSLLGSGDLLISGSGVAFDQALNTTDDVVFNSALVGDVSIIGDTISAIDSYGLSKDLIIDSKIIAPALDVRVYTDTTESYNVIASGGMSPYLQNFPGSTQLSIYNYSGENSAVITALTAEVGSRVNFTINSYNGTSSGYFIVSSVSSGSISTVYLSEFVVTSGDPLYYYQSSIYSAALTIGGIAESLPLSVTESGVNVNGAFTVNGQPLSSGASSFDQDLNTADDVVFNSALIGDVSIVGNTIAALDSYGNAAELKVSASDVVFDSNLNLSINTLIETAETISDSSYMNQFRIDQMPNSFAYYGTLSAEDAAKLKTGAIVTLVDQYGGGTAVIQLTSDMIDAAGWSASYTFITNPSQGYNYRAYSITVSSVSGSTANYGFDDQGTLTAPAISTNSINTNSLLINGSAPSLLIDNQDGSKSIEVPKPVTTTYSGLYWNSAYWYGNTSPSYQQGKLLVSGPSQTTVELFNSLVVGDKLTLNVSFPGNSLITLTVQTAGFNYDMMAGYYVLDVVETNNSPSNYEFYYTPVLIETIGTLEYNFAGDGLTASNIIADSALIGDVSIVGNTIAGLDSYGLADKLVVDGDLEVTGSLITVIPEYASIGSYIFAMNTAGQIVSNQLYAGSNLRAAGGTSFQAYYPDDYSGWSYTAGGDPLPGTWKAMGRATGQSYGFTLFIRIA